MQQQSQKIYIIIIIIILYLNSISSMDDTYNSTKNYTSFNSQCLLKQLVFPLEDYEL